ncbi:nucleic acid-binding protein [Halobacteriales archaeon QS_4_69_34]|nr:MAG: nucleic acid-binding protein [Halobacteriales archaeon QS_4_69_34]
MSASTDNARDEGYDDLLDAVADGEGYYLECPAGHGWLPPRRVCSECGARELAEEPLPESGTVETHTTIAVPTPRLADDAPFVTALADFGPVRLTGQLREIDPEDVETGLSVGVDVGESVTTGDRVLVFRPR